MFPDVELWATTYLRDALKLHGYTGVYVSNHYLQKPVEVWVRRDGGPVLDQVREAARLTINVFATGDNDQPVSDLARTVSAIMRAGAVGPVVRVTQTTGPTPVPDTLPRRLIAFEVVVRGTEL